MKNQFTTAPGMTGAEALVGTLLAGGVDSCFTNPGTSEIHLVAALDQTPEIRCVLGLFEGVLTGAADGYARMAGKPACTLLHLGPGFANGLANLHNANRAKVPMVNIVGQHARYHLRHDTPLTSDIESLARPYSKWLRTVCGVSEVGHDTAEAIVAARTAPGRIATLIVPADVAWSQGGSTSDVLPARKPSMPAGEAITRAAAMLRSGQPTALLLSGQALHGRALRIAGEIAELSGAKLLCPYPFARLERGIGIPLVQRVHYILEQAKEQLSEFHHFILVGASAPIAYFAHPEKDSRLAPLQSEFHTLVTSEEDYIGGLEAVLELLPAQQARAPVLPQVRPVAPNGEITLSGLAAAIGAVLPEDAILVDESMTSGRGIMAATTAAPPHDWLGNTGGSIGIALPLAVGAAVACPGRRILCLSADGSGMYTVQALWTMAREGMKITTVVFANRAYAVLKREYASAALGEPGPRALDLFDIGRPDLDWVHLAEGMGVPGVRVRSLEAFVKALLQGFESDGPMLIEVPL
jgi:acetolactate synthase I/II/III large subunit